MTARRPGGGVGVWLLVAVAAACSTGGRPELVTSLPVTSLPDTSPPVTTAEPATSPPIATASPTTAPSATTAAAAGDLVAGAFDTSESVIVAEIYAQALEATGLAVGRRFGLSDREAALAALSDGEIDILPEHTGSLLEALDGTATSDGEQTHREATTALEETGLTLLDSSPAETKTAFVVTPETSERLRLAALSDLEPVAGRLRLGGSPRCPEEPRCLPGLSEVYGLEFADFVPLDDAGPRTASALDRAEIDVAVLSTTDQIIGDEGWVVLEDDRGLVPAENLVPLVRQEVLEDHPELATVLNTVSTQISTEAIAALTGRAEGGEDAAVIAADWLGQAGVTDG